MRTACRPAKKRKRAGLLFAAVSAALVMPGVAAGQQTDWIGGTSNWSDPSNWDNGEPLTAGETVNIVNADSTDRTISYDYGGAAVALGAVDVSNSGGGTNSLSMTAAGLTLSSSGENIGGYAGSTGNGVGLVSQSAGLNSVGTLVLGFNAGDTGAYGLSGTGEVDAFKEEVGENGAGSFNQSGGTNQVLGSLSIASNSEATGSYTLSAGSATVYSGVTIGGSSGEIGTGLQGGAGSLTINGTGQLSVSGTLQIYPGSQNLLNLNGGTLSLQQSVGGSISQFVWTGGALDLTNGQNITIDNTSAGNFGDSASGPDSFVLSAGQALKVNGNESVGFSGMGSFSESGGSNTATSLTLAVVAGSTGTYNLSGTGSLSGTEFVGSGGKGCFNQSGGSNAERLIVGDLSGSIGQYNQSGGTNSAGLSPTWEGGEGSVPEPGGLAVGVVGCGGLVGRRRRGRT